MEECEKNHLVPFSLFCVVIFIRKKRRWKGRRLVRKLRKKSREERDRRRENMKGREGNSKIMEG